MNRYEMLEVEKAIEDCRNGRLPAQSVQRRTPNNNREWRSPHRKWDRIMRLICSGCGKTLSQYEIKNHLSFCLHCRRFLYPDTVAEQFPSQRNNYPKRYPRQFQQQIPSWRRSMYTHYRQHRSAPPFSPISVYNNNNYRR